MNEELREEEGYEFIVAGDTAEYKGCLVFTCGKSLEHAKKVLQESLEGTDPSTARTCKRFTNLRLKRVKSADAWWHGNLD